MKNIGNNFRIAAIAAIAAATVGCNREAPVDSTEPVAQERYVSFIATAPSAQRSRAGYDAASHRAVWHAGDMIGVKVVGASTPTACFTQKEGTLSPDGRTVEYEGSLQDGGGEHTVFACYPFDALYDTSTESLLYADFPGLQEYSAQGYCGIPLFARYSGPIADLAFGTFRNPFAVIELRLASEEAVKVKRIIFQGNNAETVAGAMAVDMSNERPVVSFIGKPSTRAIVLDCGEGVELTAEPKSFYIAVPVQEYVQGCRFDVRTDRQGANAVVLTRNSSFTPVENTIIRTPERRLQANDFKHIVPDANFRAWLAQNGLVAVDDPTTGEVTVINPSATEMDCSQQRIASLEGIEYFGRLTTLNITQNPRLSPYYYVSALDVTQNTELKELRCDYNQLTSLDVSQNLQLEALYCTGNPLKGLDVTRNAELTRLECLGTGLKTLDVTQNPNLTYLGCSYNQLTGLNLSHNSKLSRLECSNNFLTELDASGMAEPGSFSLYCGDQRNAAGTGVVLALTLREEQRRRWETLSSSTGNASVSVSYKK